MKLESITDIENLPSVLDVDEVSVRLLELIEVLRKNETGALEGAEAINYLISYQGYNRKGISAEASVNVIEWTAEIYDAENEVLTEWNIANIANMQRDKSIEFLKAKLKLSITEFEQRELVEALNEIGVKT